MMVTAKWWRVLRITAGFLPLIVWVVAGAAVARMGAEVVSSSPVVSRVLVGGVAVVFGLGGLWLFWVLADRVEFDVRGYRVSLCHKDCMYQERTATGLIQYLAFVQEIVGDGDSVRWRVLLPDEASWDSDVAQWAKGRRKEIVERISKAIPYAEIAATRPLHPPQGPQ